ncbi:MAG: hypothetical protein H7249_00280 [Chitinophagaceae bacterium]|nr:hypothetical protein [Oligoflexus sp.]
MRSYSAFFTFLFGLVTFLNTQGMAASRKPWAYSVRYEAKSGDLHITAQLPEGRLILNNDGAVYVSAVQALDGKAREGTNSWTLPHCSQALCTITYIFHLRNAAKNAGKRDDIIAFADAIMSIPSLWLLRPSALPDSQPVTFRFEASDGAHVTTGLFPSPHNPKTFVSTADHLMDLPYTLFGAYHAKSWTVQGAAIELAIIPAAYGVTDVAIEAWSKRAVDALIRYYGVFPVPHAMIVVVSRAFYDGPGKSFGDGGGVTVNPLSPKAGEAELERDWVMTHEIVHLALPSVPYQHHWLEEGLATYIEPIARVRSGELTAESVFADMMDGMPKGQPQSGDKGLDGPSSWGRTYWGGALFSLLADKEFRERSHGKVGLEHALRGILANGGSMAVNWDIDRVFATGDKAAGYPVLSELYARMKDQAVTINLDELWKNLGVVRALDGKVYFDDKAPLASVRRAIITGL